MGALLGLLFTCFPKLFHIPVADHACQQYFKSSLIEAGASYLTCRGVIGGLDVIEHTEFEITPAGVGIDAEPARMTDPLRDVAERASDAMFTAIMALTAEEIGYDITRTLGGRLIGIALLAASIAACFLQWSNRHMQMLLRILLFLLALRLAMPASAGVCDVVNSTVFAPKIAAATASVNRVFPAKTVNALSDWNLPTIPSSSWYSVVPKFIKAYGGYAWGKLDAAFKATTAITLHMKTMADDLTNLSALFIAQIIFQAILIPLAGYWILVRLFRQLFDWIPPASIKPGNAGS